ncbi:MAG: hypothetical protein AMXMBFR84_23390 [Candidatus Hydrogenedentota bacterium]
MTHIQTISKPRRPALAQSILVVQQKLAAFGTLATAFSTLATATSVLSAVGLNIWEAVQDYKNP